MKKVLLAALLLLPLAASAQELTYKNLKRAGATRFTDCNMFGDQTSVRVYQRNVLKFKVSGPKKYYKLGSFRLLALVPALLLLLPHWLYPILLMIHSLPKLALRQKLPSLM
jgi:hypothetical protein